MTDSETSSLVILSGAPGSRPESSSSEVTPAAKLTDAISHDTMKDDNQSGSEEKLGAKEENKEGVKTKPKDKNNHSKEKRKKSKGPKKGSDAGGSDNDSGSDSGSGNSDGESEKILVGAVAEHKNLYEKRDKHNRVTWTEKIPEDLEEAGENDETLKFAVIVRLRRPNNDSRKALEIDSVIIQSPYIKRVLNKTLANYPGVNTTLSRLIFKAPFECLVHRWDGLVAEMESDEWDEITKKHLTVLYDILHPELKDVLEEVKDFRKNGIVNYEHVWTIFQPGCTALGSRYGHPLAMEFISGQFGETQCDGPCYIMRNKFVDYNGSQFGLNDMMHTIPKFDGVIPITDLPCYPIEFHPDATAMTEALTARGRLFESLAGYHYKYCNGQGITKDQNGNTVRVTVNCRVVIDAEMFSKFNPNMVRSLSSLRSTERNNGGAGQCFEDDGMPAIFFPHRDFDSSDDESTYESSSKKALRLTDQEALTCNPMVKGYALKVKRWLEFYVGDISDVVFNKNAFGSLVLPEDQKNLILAFAQSQVKFKDEFDDVIEGKGKGIIMLLSGGPGIGKTLTAESVAEEMRVPLYIVSAGDLGSNADDIEYNLSNILEMMAKWDSVLLLDECDVFLEARSPHDLGRNRVVSIFLRTLEYYEGILFLTTNRVNDMDPAFHSRIHLSLEYPPLDEEARKAVWAGFLERGRGKNALAHCLAEEEIDRLARLDINGRQIKNALKMANLLSCHKGEMLNFDHLRTVLKVEGYSLAA